MSNELLKMLGKVEAKPGAKPGLTSAEIAEESGLPPGKVADLLKAGVAAGTVEPVKWVDPEHWSGRPRLVMCWKVK